MNRMGKYLVRPLHDKSFVAQRPYLCYKYALLSFFFTNFTLQKFVCAEMENRKKDDNVTDADPNNVMHHFQFGHAIDVAMGNKCPTAEWRSWKDVLENAKKTVMDELLVRILLMDE